MLEVSYMLFNGRFACKHFDIKGLDVEALRLELLKLISFSFKDEHHKVFDLQRRMTSAAKTRE